MLQETSTESIVITSGDIIEISEARQLTILIDSDSTDLHAIQCDVIQLSLCVPVEAWRAELIHLVVISKDFA
mgnify:FL=1